MNTINILVVEDSLSDALLLEAALEGEKAFPYTLKKAERLADSVALIASHEFNVILTDLGLPDSQGLATFKGLHQAAPALPIIVLTRQGDMETAVAAIKLGAQDYLPKGEMTGFMLSRMICHAIERKQLVRQLEDALENIKTLSGLLPICCGCKKIRDDSGYWNQIETYIAKHSGASFTHGLCPECAIKTLEASGIPVSAALLKAAGRG